MKRHWVLLALGLFIGLSLTSSAAWANTVGSGSFYISGSTYLSTTVTDFGLNSVPPPGDQLANIDLPTTGAFSYLTSTDQAGIHNLNLASATVTSTNINFDGSEPDWITLPGGIDLSLTDIPINDLVPVCSTLSNPDALGTECRPYASSPLVLSQDMNTVTLSWKTEGNAYFTSSPGTLTPYTGTFTSQFAGPDGTIDGLLNTFNSTGSLTFSYSANFITTPATSPVPEPGTFLTLGIGLLASGLLFGRKKVAARI